MAYIIHIYVFFFACELAQDPIGVLLTPAFILIVEYFFGISDCISTRTSLQFLHWQYSFNSHTKH